MTPFRSLGIATAANVAGTGTELWTGDKSKGDTVRNGTMLALSLLNPTSAKNIAKIYINLQTIFCRKMQQ